MISGLILCLFSAGLFLWMRNPRPAAPAHTEYTQLTYWADSATSPALSADGRMLAFIRGESPFLGPGDVYLKLLPDGDPVRLTHDDHPKMGLAFSPDSSKNPHSWRRMGWQGWTVPALGGEPTELLPNASALTWVGPHQVMFSEQDKAMKIVTAGESRANERDVYVPKVPIWLIDPIFLPIRIGAGSGDRRIRFLVAVSIGSVFGGNGRGADPLEFPSACT